MAIPVYNQMPQGYRSNFVYGKQNKRSPSRKAHLLLKAVDKYSKKQAGIGNAVQRVKEAGFGQGFGHQPGSCPKHMGRGRSEWAQ